MQNQYKKIIRWILGGGILAACLIIPEILIAKLIFNNNPNVYMLYAGTMILITMFIYLIISVIKIAQYQKFVNEYEQNKEEVARKELTTEFKPVLLNYSGCIPKDYFQCKAKIGEDGKIVCKIQLDYEAKIEDYEKFLKIFHFDQE